jgi:organic hydroperoxide reductase OsmC/OhrA
MARLHTYDVSVTWTGNRGTGTSGYRDYDRAHEVSADGPAAIAASSDPTFRGDAGRWNPELELTAALSQCHLLGYLHLCADAGVTVTSYRDEAHAKCFIANSVNFPVRHEPVISADG